jgi:hypothetical protein
MARPDLSMHVRFPECEGIVDETHLSDTAAQGSIMPSRR